MRCRGATKKGHRNPPMNKWMMLWTRIEFFSAGHVRPCDVLSVTQVMLRVIIHRQIPFEGARPEHGGVGRKR